MRKILVIGIGAGDPDFMTVQAINALNRVDVFFIPDKGEEKAALRHLRNSICDRFIRERSYRTVEAPIPARRAAGDDYRGAVHDWHEEISHLYERFIMEELDDGQCGGALVWGDPAIYDSTLRILDRLQRKGRAFDVEIIPGISAVQVLAARHRIALNTVGRPVLITTGRKLTADFSGDADSVIVMLDGEQAFKRVRAEGVDIYWGAYLGTPDEILVAGKLSEVGGEIERIRSEAREKHGWIMDTYLLRKTDGD
ncbi:precorrin-6A synthase (deacetylating) [Rhodoblastus sp.]|uniref:precorrin-6A synthase (deacetylating) n=1 Tax=Rhodoblastus sp. TaxID=1962975 RepID=UPI00260D0EDB|nr:precorrin-6A synthase (deacetylating) [Rhodoblastus sp.]